MGDKIQKILERCKCSFTIEVNDHRDVYETVETYVSSEDISPEVLAEMIAKDTVVRVQFYPDTPVGFYVIYHHDLDAALNEAIQIIEGLNG
jgi:hypothetical protein